MESFKINSIKEEGKQLYFKKFYDSLNSYLIKYYGLSETEKIFKALEKGILNISNIQTFFCYGNHFFIDPSHNVDIKENITLENYLLKILFKCKEEAERNPEITISYFLITIITRFQQEIKTEEGERILREFFNNFFYSFLEPSKENKIKIKIFENLSETAFEKGGKSKNNQYRSILRILFEVYKSIFTQIPSSYSIPKVEVIHYVYEYTRVNQIHYLEDVFGYIGRGSIGVPRKLTEHISDLGEDTPELRAVLNILKENSPRADITEFFEESVIAELKYIKENCDAKSFLSSINPEIYVFWGVLLGSKAFPEKYNIIRSFVPITEVHKLIKEVFAEVSINCSNFEDFTEIKTFINLAAELVLIRYREIKHEENPVLNIILKNIPWNTLNIIENVREEEANLLSKYNVKFNIIPYIKQESAIAKYGHSEPQYFRVISDIHTDINKDMKYSFNFGKDYVLCCGDIASNFRIAKGWLSTNVQRGAYVTGNHLGYSSARPEKDKEEGLKEKYGMQFHPNNTRNKQATYLNTSPRKGVTYLNNTITEINGIKIFGAPLYTNFELFGKAKADACAMLCQHKINDFKYVKIYRDREIRFSKDNESWEITKCIKPYITNLTPDICKFYFNRTINKFKDFCKSSEYNGEPLIFMSHFGVSMYSIAERYKSDPVSAYFASDMVEIFREMLDKEVNLRLIVHGHIHNKCEYILKYGDKEILVVADPFGYYHEREDNQQDQSNYGRRIKIKDVKEGELWSKIYPEIPVYFI